MQGKRLQRSHARPTPSSWGIDCDPSPYSVTHIRRNAIGTAEALETLLQPAKLQRDPPVLVGSLGKDPPMTYVEVSPLTERLENLDRGDCIKEKRLGFQRKSSLFQHGAGDPALDRQLLKVSSVPEVKDKALALISIPTTET